MARLQRHDRPGLARPAFGRGIAIGPNGQLITIPQGEGLAPATAPPRLRSLRPRQGPPITRGLPAHWPHPSEQLTHGQHGPAESLTILTYAFSEVSRQGEPMDWVREYGKGRVYTTMLGHTWKNEANPNLDDMGFQTLLARGAEWAATGKVTLPSTRLEAALQRQDPRRLGDPRAPRPGASCRTASCSQTRAP